MFNTEPENGTMSVGFDDPESEVCRALDEGYASQLPMKISIKSGGDPLGVYWCRVAERTLGNDGMVNYRLRVLSEVT